ncbi:MAG: hypothetical protein K0R69_871 [Clostridia bacterium]|nr:hypothetical protein [Clostridia bacterium]
MKDKKNRKRIKIIFGLICLTSFYFNMSFGTENDISQFVSYLAENDIIMTPNTKNNTLYEGYDYKSKATYKVKANEEGVINDFTIELVDTTFEKLNLNKILGLRWFMDHHLEKNEDFLKTIKENLKNVTEHYSYSENIGEWKMNVFVFPLQGGKLDISLHFMEDATEGKENANQTTLSSLKNIYHELGGIQTQESVKPSDKMSCKLPYYKLNTDESIYYHSFINKNNNVYKTQFIFYKNGFEFSYKDIPQLKQIIYLVTQNKNYPLDKLNIQFNHLKEAIHKDKFKNYKNTSAWEEQGIKTSMDIERYTHSNQCRIKITIYLVKK